MANEQALTSPQRLAALHKSGLLESSAEERLDHFTRLAAQILGVPKVVISLVDETRQYFKSVACPGGSESAGWHPLDACYCQDVIGSGRPLILADAWNEPGFADRGSSARAYAGIPLRTANGDVLGVFCAFDERPRDWSKRDIDVMTALSFAVMSEIQRRIAERSAHDTQLRLVAERTLAHAVQQQMPVGVVVAEVPSGRLVSVNSQMTEIFRAAFKPAPDLKSYEWTGFHDDGRCYSAFEWPIARTVFTKEPVGAEEIRIRRGDGSDGFVRMSSAPVRDSEGNVVAAVAIVVDVTEQRKAERAVRTTDERFKFVAKATNDVIWDWDIRTNSLVWNDSVESVFGHKQNRIYPEIRWWHEHLHPQDRDRVIAGIHAVIDGGGSSWSDQYRYRRRDGTYANVMDRGYIARDSTGAAVRMIGAMTDVTERSRSEAAIRFQAQLLNAVQQAVVATDPEGHVIFWNTFAEKLYGWAAEEAVGKQIEELTPSPFLRQHASEIFQRGAAGESWTGEFLVQGKAAKPFPALLTTAPVRDEHGTVLGFVRVSIDLTERRNLEEQFRQSQKMDAVGRLAGGIAHDFNNLLTVIRLNTEIIMEGFDPTDPRSEDVKQIRSAAERASRKQILQPRVLDMNSVVASVEPMLCRLIGEDIVIASNCTARGYVVADPGQLEQILVNLVVNARDAMPQGGRISVETQNVELDETYTSEHAPVVPGRYVMLAVGDTGVGMSRDTREHAFDPFFTTKEAGKGTGLGLATVYGIVKQSGGYVWIYSEPGHGTTLKLYFPEVSSAAAFKTGEYKIVPKPHARGSETILLVEDEEAVRGLTSRILEKQGYRVIPAQHGREAMDIATKEEGHIDLVLTDIVMPGMNGRGLVERLAGIRPRIKSLYMSGYTDDDIVRRGFIEPSKSFLQKPFTSEALLQTVRKVLDEG